MNDSDTAAPAAAGRLRAYLGLLACNAMVFVASVCVMALELTAARLIAKSVGSSLYTWTSVIGVVLAGITLGNFVGGWLADRFPPRRTLAYLFLTASALCLSVLWLDQAMAGAPRPVGMDWPRWILMVVASMFLLPSAAMGAISPVVASLALSARLGTGITVGNIYAWGAMGSIVGTFLTGFWLIDVFGTRALVAMTALVLATIAVLVAAGQRVFRVAVLVGWMQFALLIGLVASANRETLSSVGYAIAELASRGLDEEARFERTELTAHAYGQAGDALHRLGIALGLRNDDPDHYHDESAYSYINVGDDVWDGDPAEVVRYLKLDKLIHAHYNPERPDKLYYEYEQVYAEVTERMVARRRAAEPDATVRTMFIGGGGFVFPRWIERRYGADSLIDVAEIDPAVKRAVQRAMGLAPDHATAIRTHLSDGRNFVDDRLRANADAAVLYDFIYGDAFNDFSVPWHLVTLEFNRKVRALLAPEGVYLVNLIDVYPRTEYTGLPFDAPDEPDFAPHLPTALRPASPLEAQWNAAPAPFEAIEVYPLRDGAGFRLAVRGAMTDGLRADLLALADDDLYRAAIDELHRESQRQPYGRFLGRFVRTLSESFDNIYVYSTRAGAPHDDRDTFVIVAARQPLPLTDGVSAGHWDGPPFAVLEARSQPHADANMQALLGLAGDALLTDDFAPVDKLLLPVVATQQ